MRLLLVAPSRSEALVVAGRKMSMAPPMNLGIVASLTPPHWDVEIADENIQTLDYDAKVDLVGITATTKTASQAYSIAGGFRRRGVPVVLGGIHPSTLPEESCAHADAVVVGEAENVWPRLIQDFENGRLERIYRSSQLAAPESIPVPRRDLFKSKGYLTIDTVSTTRGCPYACSFCTVSRVFGQAFRLRPLDAVLREIDHLQAKTVYFIDDNIVGNPRYAKDLFRALTPRKIRWAGQSSISLARDQDLLRLAAASGCMGLFIGFESIDTESLRQVGKKANVVADYEAAVKRMHQHGLAVFGAFIFGFDEDDEGVFERTVQFARRAKLEGAQFNTLTPYPGTGIFAQLQKEGRLLTTDWSRYNMSDVVFAPKKMSPETLRQGHDWAWREFYSLPSILDRLPLLRLRSMPSVLLLNWLYRRHWYGRRPEDRSDREPAIDPTAN
ncbi:MAG: B12-binding domain-containing radical SAM protein [Chloroflexota bacterium]